MEIPSWTEIDRPDQDRAVSLETARHYLVSRYLFDFLAMLLKNTI